MPFSTVKEISVIDALFLSVSGLSITGLSTFNISDSLSEVGKILLMIEIQFGGIGIMVIIGSLIMFFTKNLSIFQQTLLTFDTNQFSLKSVKKLTIFIFIYTFLIEFIASVLFYSYIKLIPEYKEDAILIAIFHSISSFTNSGFDLFNGSLNSFNSNPFFLLTTSLLLIMGSIGFPSILELIFKKNNKFSLYTKINFIMHGIILSISTIFFLSVEFKNSFIDLNLIDKISNSIFLSSTIRNGGFNSLEISSLTSSSILLIMILMFIGGSASSCGGGIRVTTFFVIIANIYNVLKGRSEVVIFKKSLYKEEVDKANVILVSFISIYLFSVMLLSIIEDISFNKLAFEVMSALTTTGFSYGITDQFSVFSLLWLCLLMIIGRIGIIAFIYSIIKPKKSSIRYSKEHIIIG